jgi:hypothetical protein
MLLKHFIRASATADDEPIIVSAMTTIFRFGREVYHQQERCLFSMTVPRIAEGKCPVTSGQQQITGDVAF